jgi:hypothetical protein
MSESRKSLHGCVVLSLPVENPGQTIAAVSSKSMSITEFVSQDCHRFREVLQCGLEVSLGNAHIRQSVQRICQSDAVILVSTRLNLPSTGLNTLETS